jgi:O-antigen/teichoic acid export membrane protein
MTRSEGVKDDSAPATELRDHAVHGIRWSAISRPTIEVLQLASIVVLARLIVPAEFGRFAIALIAQQIAYTIVAGGLSAALVQRKSVSRGDLRTGMSLALISGVLLAALTVAAAYLVVTPIFGHRTGLFVLLMAPLCLVSALNVVPAATLGRRMAFRRLSEIEITNTVARVAVCIGLAIAGLEGEALVIGVVVGSSAAVLLAWISAPPPRPGWDGKVARGLMDFSLPASMAAVSWVGFNNVDYAIIGGRLGAVQTGYYFRAYTLAVEYQAKISLVMTQVGFPVLSRTRESADLVRFSHQMVRLLTTLLFPILVLLAMAAPVVVPFLFGPRWEPAVVPVQILALGGAATLVINAVGAVLMAKGRARALLGFGTAHFLAYGVTAYLVVPYGITAVAIDAAVVHSLFMVVAYWVMLRDERGRFLSRLWSDIAPATVSCVGLAAVAFPVSVGLTALGLPSALWLLALGLAAAPPYLLTLRLLFPDAWRTQRGVLKRVLPLERIPVLRLRRSGVEAEAPQSA